MVKYFAKIQGTGFQQSMNSLFSLIILLISVHFFIFVLIICIHAYKRRPRLRIHSQTSSLMSQKK